MRTYHLRRLLPISLLGMLATGCAAADFPTALASFSGSVSPSNSLVSKRSPLPDNAPGAGGGVSAAPTAVTTGVTTALFQTAVGPVGLKGVQVVCFSTASAPVLLWNSIPTRYTSALAVVTTTLGWGVGSAIGRCENGDWTTEASDVDASMSLSVPSRQRVELLDVSFAPGSSTVGFAVGTHGTVLRYDAARQRWAQAVLPAAAASKNFGSVKALGANDVWVAGEALLHFDGSHWALVAMPAGESAVSGLTSSNGGDLWASTGDELIRWDGTQWLSAFSLPDHSLGSPVIQAFGSTVVGLCLEPGVPGGLMAALRSGTTWETSTATIPEGVGLDTLVLADEHTAYAKAYDNSGVWRYDLTSKTWSRYTD